MSTGILLVGCGKMGGAMLAGWLRDDTISQITVIDPLASDLPDDPRVRLAANVDAPGAASNADLVVLAVKPQAMDEVLPGYRRLVSPERVFLSIAAGKSIGYFRRILGDGARVVRAMPNIPAALGQGASGLFAGPGVDQRQKDQCETAMAAAGIVEWVPEERLIDAVTGVSGSGPAYFFYMVECLAAAGRARGLPADVADRLARRTLWGAASMVEQGSETPATLRRNVTSPGGTTEAALKVLMSDDGLEALMDRAVLAAVERGGQLSD